VFENPLSKITSCRSVRRLDEAAAAAAAPAVGCSGTVSSTLAVATDVLFGVLTHDKVLIII